MAVLLPCGGFPFLFGENISCICGIYKNRLFLFGGGRGGAGVLGRGIRAVNFYFSSFSLTPFLLFDFPFFSMRGLRAEKRGHFRVFYAPFVELTALC